METEPFLHENNVCHDHERTNKFKSSLYIVTLLALLSFFICLTFLLNSFGYLLMINQHGNFETIFPHNSHQLDPIEMLKNVEKESNLASLYWNWWVKSGVENYDNRKNSVKYCDSVSLTEPFSLRQNNLYWQLFDSVPLNLSEEVIRMYLYNAYYDSRIPNKPVIKLLTMNAQEMMASYKEWYCLLWFDGIKAPVLVKVSDYFHIWPTMWKNKMRYGYFHPQLISCPIPSAHIEDVPRAVSLQAHGECKQVEQVPSNVLRVIYNYERDPEWKKPSIGVCVKTFRFADYDMSVRLVEWLELMKMLGANRVYFYVYGTNENVQKVIKHYSKKGFVEWRYLTLPGEQVNVNSLYNMLADKFEYKFTPSESMELNDCLNRNLYLHDYLAVIDVDEVIMPQAGILNWRDLIDQIESTLSAEQLKTKAYYKHQQAHVCEMDEELLDNGAKSIPAYLHLMRHTYREKLRQTTKDKCFHRTDLVTSLHNHLPTRCIGTSGYFHCDGVSVPSDKSIMMHYRRNHAKYAGMRNNTPYVCEVHDRTIWKYYDVMKENVRKELEIIFKP